MGGTERVKAGARGGMGRFAAHDPAKRRKSAAARGANTVW